MKPILYPADSTAFTSNGLGRLPDAITCVVEEERNGKYEMTMEYPVDGLHFSDIAHSTYIKAVPADGKDPQPFRVYNISKPINGRCTVKAEHISYRLSDIPVEPFTATSATTALEGLRTHAVESCPFTFWTDKTTTADFKVDTPVSIRSLLGGMQGSILDTYGGGEYEFDLYTVKLWQNRGHNNGVTLRYGKNITDLTQEEAIDSTYTGIMPFWRASDGGTTVTLPEKVVYSANANLFPYHKTKVVDFSQDFSTQPTEAQLRTRTQRYITANNIGVPNVSIKVSFLPLWQSEEYKDIANLERVNLCDTITVKFPKLGVSATAKVVRTKYDVLAERYLEIEVGDAKTGFAKTVQAELAEAKATSRTMQSFLAAELAEATGKITGATDGFIKQIFNSSGQWSELVAMNTNDPATATKVWRMNYEGIGGGTSFNGPFTITMTLDGKINASQINTGILNANLMRAGTLADLLGNFSLDLETGTMTMKKGSINIGNGIFAVDTSGNVTMKKGSINIGNGTFVVDTTGNLTMTKGSININNGAFEVTSQGVVTAKNGTFNGTMRSQSQNGQNWIEMQSGWLNAGYGSTTYGVIRTRTVNGNNGLAFETNMLVFDSLSHLYVEDNGSYASGYSGQVKMPTSINSDGTVATWTNGRFINGIYVA